VSVRAKRARQAARLKEREGLNAREIAYRMGISKTYAFDLLNDPEGLKVKARKESYRGICEVCGAFTNGADGPTRAPRFCNHCAPAAYHLKWTKERVVEAIQRWAKIFGRPPLSTEWLHGQVVDGYEFPANSSVYDSHNDRSYPCFNNWADAIEAAGFPRPHRGRYERTPECRSRMSASRRRLDYDEILRLAHEGLTYYEIARRHNCSAGAVCRIAIAAGIKRGRGWKPKNDEGRP
jgi:hypothetical protein